MARSLNKVTLIGNVGVNPEIRYTQNGSVIAVLSLATSSVWKDKNTGQQQEKTEWHRITIFNKLAEIVQNLVKKGSKLYIEGKLQTRKWQDQKTGEDKYTTEIVVDFGGQLILLDSRSDNHSNSNSNNNNHSYNNSNNGYYMGDKKQVNNSSQGNNYYQNNNNTQFKPAAAKTEDNMHNRGNELLQMPTMPLSSSPEKAATTDDSYKQQATQFDRFEDEIPF
jgi:single-strand DNA-binding protein